MTVKEPSGTGVLRRLNTVAVLTAVRSAGDAGARIAELATDTRLTRPTVAQAIDDLVAGRYVLGIAAGSGRPTVGRPAMRYRLRPGLLPVLGLDIGPHRLSAAVSDLQGVRLAAADRAVRPPRNAASVSKQLTALIDRVLRATGLEQEQIASVVAGSPGVIEVDEADVRMAPSVPGWAASGVFSALSRRFAGRAMVENDANLAAVAAAAEHPGRTLVVIHWGERLGAGIVIDGALHRGAHRAAGEIGMIPVSAAGVRFDDEGRGPLEHLLGAAGIVANARATAEGFPDSSLAGVDQLTAQDVFAAAERGDPAAVRVTARVARVMIQRLAPVILTVDPDALVLSGGVARAGAFLVDQLRRELPRYTLVPPELQVRPDADRAVLDGALSMARSRAWDRLTDQLRNGDTGRSPRPIPDE
ncbi:ROK family protein [Nakamurella lactea]|uniref:ROK family protein n=1 Tax=Nakamurella lactea TaxID=459515 RepID=UPI0006850D88|nr:ROK family protein [Nakamurella lactea]